MEALGRGVWRIWEELCGDFGTMSVESLLIVKVILLVSYGI